MTNYTVAPDALTDDLHLAIHAAKKAGEYILKKFRSGTSVELKPGNQSPVTEVDRNAEQIIADILTDGSDHGIVGEEGTALNAGQQSYWIIDPIDGTSNYIHNISYFSVSIALADAGKIRSGVIYNPVTDECYFAEKGVGAFKNHQAISVNHDELLPSLILIEHGRSEDSRSRYAELVERVSAQHTMRKFGSTALELCYVAAGQADVFISCGGHIWDFAAGIILVTEAGGQLTDWKGDEWSGDHSFIVASSGVSHNSYTAFSADLQPETIPNDERNRFSYR